MIEARNLLAYLAIIHQGDYDRMIAAIKAKEHVDSEAMNQAVKSLKCSFVTILDENYPVFFRNIQRPPLVLFYYGKWELTSDYKKNIAVIGTRHPDEYGLNHTRSIVHDLAKNGLTIVSGLAQGIDRAAHEAAIAGGGKTIAILGSGIDNPYPKANKELYETIKRDHLIISEYPGDVAPEAGHFPLRNRLVAALSRAVFVSEAHARSGTMITVGHALLIGRDIYCLPYPAGAGSSCNRLIKDGAYLVETASDIIDLFQNA